MVGLLGFLVFGAIVGALARLLLPGRDPMGCVATTALGAVGSLVGGLLAAVLFGDGIDLSENGLFFYRAGWLGSIVGAIVVLLIVRATARRPRF